MGNDDPHTPTLPPISTMLTDERDLAALLEHFEENLGQNGPTGKLIWGGHAICTNLRGEMKASAQERTMLELTHCCGTLDYLGPENRESKIMEGYYDWHDAGTLFDLEPDEAKDAIDAHKATSSRRREQRERLKAAEEALRRLSEERKR